MNVRMITLAVALCCGCADASDGPVSVPAALKPVSLVPVAPEPPQTAWPEVLLSQHHSLGSKQETFVTGSDRIVVTRGDSLELYGGRAELVARLEMKVGWIEGEGRWVVDGDELLDLDTAQRHRAVIANRDEIVGAVGVWPPNVYEEVYEHEGQLWWMAVDREELVLWIANVIPDTPVVARPVTLPVAPDGGPVYSAATNTWYFATRSDQCPRILVRDGEAWCSQPTPGCGSGLTDAVTGNALTGCWSGYAITTVEGEIIAIPRFPYADEDNDFSTSPHVRETGLHRYIGTTGYDGSAAVVDMSGELISTDANRIAVSEKYALAVYDRHLAVIDLANLAVEPVGEFACDDRIHVHQRDDRFVVRCEAFAGRLAHRCTSRTYTHLRSQQVVDVARRMRFTVSGGLIVDTLESAVVVGELVAKQEGRSRYYRGKRGPHVQNYGPRLYAYAIP